MNIRRTANAGVLLELDGLTLLLDGVCRQVRAYLPTPAQERESLMQRWPDVVAFTHIHADHYDPDFAAAYKRQTDGVILGCCDLPDCQAQVSPLTVGGVKITPVPTRHIGAAGKDTLHYSFVIEASACIWFMGDASPLQCKQLSDFPRPDILLAPFAYVTTPAAQSILETIAPKHAVILHLPAHEHDPDGLWQLTKTGISEQNRIQFFTPDISQTLQIP